MIKIAVYGKGGIGKSTTTSNLAAAFANKGYKVMQIGCDPKADSTKNLLDGKNIPTVLDKLKEKGNDITLDDIVCRGYADIACVEAGGPTPGIGCAGRGIIAAFEKLEELNAYERYKPDIILYDVLGDVVCGGFAMPIRGGYADYVLIVTSGEMMALFAADNICRAVRNFGNRGYAKILGYVQNSRNVEDEDMIVEKAAKESETEVISIIPRDPAVQIAESQGKTVIEVCPDSAIAGEYNALADKLTALMSNDAAVCC